MPRTAAQKRRPTPADLDETQRRIYDALPPELKDDYLRGLPDIPVASAQAKRKARQIEERVRLLDRAVSDLQSHKQHLSQLARDLEHGADPDSVDLRQQLKPPSIDGVVLRFVRGPRGESE